MSVLTKDIQFRGAISDFHAFRAPLKAADYDPLVIRSNPEDVYGDGNNFEPKPWTCLGSEEEVRAASIAPALLDAAVQATREPLRRNCSQYAPRELGADEQAAILASPEFADFLARIRPRWEAALAENAAVNILEDDLAALADEDGPSGGRAKASLSELQSFTDLAYSKGRSVAALQWLPHRKGVVAVACIEVAPTDTAVHGVLLWSFRDPIRPELVLECQVEDLTVILQVGSFQINPAMPHLVAGGCITGQVVLWDASGAEAQAPRVAPAFISSLELSHRAPVCALQWLPGVLISKQGSRPPTAEDGPKLGPNDCVFFATTAADGRVLFWDCRGSFQRRRAKKEADEPEWRPVFTLGLKARLGGMLPAARLSFMAKGAAAQSAVAVSSCDGELVWANYASPEGRADGEEAAAAPSVQAHAGGTAALQRSPFHEDLLLSAGAWTWAVWRERTTAAPLLMSPAAPALYTAAAWSPSRPGVIFVGREDGVLEVWDLLDRSHEPVLVATPSAAAISSLAFSPVSTSLGRSARPVQQLLAIGDGIGVTRIMELPRSLRRREASETRSMSALLAREAARIQWSAARAPERARLLKQPDNQATCCTGALAVVMKCNSCWNGELEPESQAVATACAHLFCIPCAQKIFESESACPVCEEVISKSTVKLVKVLQGESAFQEVHNAYTAAKRKYQDATQERNQLLADKQELQQKYAQKAAQARKVADLYQKAQQENERLRANGGTRRNPTEGGYLTLGSGLHVTTPPNLGLTRGPPGSGRVVTTVHRKQVFLAPGQQGFSPTLMNNQGLFNDANMHQLRPQQSGSEGLGFGGMGVMSPLREHTRVHAKAQQPLRQLLSGNSGQARGGSGYHKPDFLGGALNRDLASL
ncbi:hypothetical protein WJX81_000804 [Elliptochloris bilobata]|uniref:RING-type domain-containing protein n=1 Tax=Elliptochloris bilobata TaxID=381761 RepID=A0AAW1QXU0_9CHLO